MLHSVSRSLTSSMTSHSVFRSAFCNGREICKHHGKDRCSRSGNRRVAVEPQQSQGAETRFDPRRVRVCSAREGHGATTSDTRPETPSHGQTAAHRQPKTHRSDPAPSAPDSSSLSQPHFGAQAGPLQPPLSPADPAQRSAPPGQGLPALPHRLQGTAAQGTAVGLGACCPHPANAASASLPTRGLAQRVPWAPIR